MTEALSTAAWLTVHPGVARCARSLTHRQVRSLTCSLAPSAGLASHAASQYVMGAAVVS
jgi:hypothetical protein